MPDFKYRAMNEDKRRIEGTLTAPDSEAAVMKIRAEGLFPTWIEQQGGQTPKIDSQLNEEQSIQGDESYCPLCGFPLVQLADGLCCSSLKCGRAIVSATTGERLAIDPVTTGDNAISKWPEPPTRESSSRSADRVFVIGMVFGILIAGILVFLMLA